MKALKKKQIVLTALVAMIGLAGYFNWMYENSDNGSVTDSDEVALGEARLVSGTNIKEDYFQKSRLERDTGRSKAIENLKTVSENPESDPETKKEAEEKLIEMAGRTEKEAAAEGEICAGLFGLRGLPVRFIGKRYRAVGQRHNGERRGKDPGDRDPNRRR